MSPLIGRGHFLLLFLFKPFTAFAAVLAARPRAQRAGAVSSGHKNTLGYDAAREEKAFYRS
jgi:hypothetical protein